MAMAAECPAQPTSKAFAAFGDTNDLGQGYLLGVPADASVLAERLGGSPAVTAEQPVLLAP